MEFRYFFSIVAFIAIGIGVFGNLDVNSGGNRVASFPTIGTASSVDVMRNPHHK